MSKLHCFNCKFHARCIELGHCIGDLDSLDDDAIEMGQEIIETAYLLRIRLEVAKRYQIVDEFWRVLELNLLDVTTSFNPN